MEKAKQNREERLEQVEYDGRQCDQNCKMEMVQHQTIFNQEKVSIM